MSEKKTNLDILARLIQRIAGSEAGDRPEMTIKNAIKELKKNKRLDPMLTKQLKRAKIVDIDAEKKGVASTFENPEDKPILEGEEAAAETPVETVDEEAKAEGEEPEEKEEEKPVEESLAFADTVVPVVNDRPAEGWWDWTWKKLNFEPTTLSWTELAMQDLGIWRNARLRGLAAMNHPGHPMSDNHACADYEHCKDRPVDGPVHADKCGEMFANGIGTGATPPGGGSSADSGDMSEAYIGRDGMIHEDEFDVWSPADEDEFNRLTADIEDSPEDSVEGMTFDDMHAWLDNMTDEELAMLHDDEIDDIYFAPDEIAAIEAEADRIAKAEVEKEFGIEDYDKEMERLMAEGYGGGELYVISEAQSLAEKRRARLKMARAMRRRKTIIAMKRRIKMKRRADLPTLMKRSIRRAREFWKEKLSKTHSKTEYMEKPLAFRVQIEDKLKKKEGAIKRLARKWLKDVRADDRARHSAQ